MGPQVEESTGRRVNEAMMRHEPGRVSEFDGDPQRRAVLPCAPSSSITKTIMTTKTSGRAAEVM